jgi:nitrogen fixation/metabolism regulation signal transduction histidine kinase
MRAVWITVGVLALSLAATFALFRGMIGLSTGVLFLTLVNINVALALILLLLLSRNLIKLYFERRQAGKGAGFKAKLVAAFLSLSLIPTILLFIVASRLITHSVEYWFSIPVEQSLDRAMEVAQGYYQERQEAVALQANRIAARMADATTDPASLPTNGVDGEVFLFSSDLLPIEVPGQRADPPTLPTDLLLRAAQSQTAITEIQAAPDGDRVFGAVAVRIDGRIDRIVVVVDRIPAELVGKMEAIRAATDEYEQLRAFKNPIKGSYLLSFLIIAMLIAFAAVWFGIYLARGITVPIQQLAQGTQEIAKGNLDVRITTRTSDELGLLVDSFNQMATDLKQSRTALLRAEKVATWQEMARQIAHEIKNPLTPIQLSTERLRKKYFDRSPDFDRIFDDATRTIINEVQGLKMLVDAFTQFAMMPPPQRTLQKIDPVIQEAVALYATGYNDLRTTTRFDPAAPPLLLDRDQIKRVFVNLFENAVDAMNGRGTLEIESRYDPAARLVRVSVSDDGIGIAPEDIPRLFLPHFSRKKRGSGLGLAIVHRIVRDHNGKIYAAPRPPQGNDPPRGTTFTLEFSV